MKLNPDEKIDSWDVVVRTTEGRELSFIGDLRIGLSDTITGKIDEVIESEYPVMWADWVFCTGGDESDENS